MVPSFPSLGLMPSGLFMGLSSTLIYTSELILCLFLVEFFPNMDISQVNQRPTDILAKKYPEVPTFYPVSGGLKFTKKSFV